MVNIAIFFFFYQFYEQVIEWIMTLIFLDIKDHKLSLMI